MNDGGLGGSQNLCDESRLSKSKKMKEIERSPEWIRRIADSHRGMKRSDSTKKKLSDSHIGKVHSNETKQKIREARKRYWDARRAGVILTPK